MPISRNEIVTVCLPVLRNAHTHSSGSRGFLTAYQIWFILLKDNLDFCNRLCAVCGSAVGKKGGYHDGPAKRIANALGRDKKRIDTLYFDPRKVFFGNTRDQAIVASGQVCGIFRIRN